MAAVYRDRLAEALKDFEIRDPYFHTGQGWWGVTNNGVAYLGRNGFHAMTRIRKGDLDRYRKQVEKK